MTDKPRVKYYADTLRFISRYGEEIATVFSIDHPIIGTSYTRTSEVLKKNEDGSFETLNTIYVPTTEPRPRGDFTTLGSEERCNSCGMVLWHCSARLGRHAVGCKYVESKRG